MRIKVTDRKAVETLVAASPAVADYARLYPDAPRRAVDIVTGLAHDYAELGMDLVLELPDDRAARVGRLAAHYTLTRSEALLALHIGDGGTLTDYARQRGLSRNTVRNQLQQVFDKTGARRQAELVKLLSDD